MRSAYCSVTVTGQVEDLARSARRGARPSVALDPVAERRAAAASSRRSSARRSARASGRFPLPSPRGNPAVPALRKRDVAIEAPQPAEERLVADQAPQHVQDGGALVVDERAEDAAVALDVTEPVAEIDRSLIRSRRCAHLRICRSTRGEHLVAALVLRVQRGEVLREAFAQPLLVVVAPADRLSPPLVRELVREEELRDSCRTPPDRCASASADDRQRLVQHREVRRGCGRRAGRSRSARA